MKAVLGFTLVSLLLLSFMSCARQWSEEEKHNADHFLNSLNLVIEAHAKSNLERPGVISEEEHSKYTSLYQLALKEANLVRDDVLDKIHPELRSNYRMYFERGAQIRVRGWTSGTIAEELEASTLMNLWGDWYEKNRRDIKIPR